MEIRESGRVGPVKLDPKDIQAVFFVFHDPKGKPKTEIYVLTEGDLEKWLVMARNAGFSPLPPDTAAKFHPRMPVWEIPKEGG